MRVLDYKYQSTKTSLHISSYLFSYDFVIYIVLILLTLSTASESPPICDYEGSGLDATGKEVESVYLSCSKGSVTWKYPRGALRITIGNPDHREFRGCIKSSTASFGSRIFVEGHRTLIRVYPEGLRKNATRCFVSYQSRISFYVEALPMEAFKKITTFFEYQLESLATDNPLEECQPCSAIQMLHNYCSADFAAIGRFVGSEDNSESEQTIITFSAARVFQQNTPVFTPWSNHSETGLPRDKNIVPGAREEYVGRLRVPIKCEAGIGAGKFVVMGTMRLGEPLLRCASNVEVWRRLVRIERGNARCVLEQ